MNTETRFQFPSVDTVLTTLVVGGMAVTCALLLVASTIQVVVA